MSDASPTAEPRPCWWFRALLLAALALALGLRVAALSAEFWFDEIWSWELARAAASAWSIFFTLHHDNNHKLNTLYLFCCPDGAPWAWYRAHSVVAGVAAVALAAWIARRWGRVEAIAAALLMASNYWLVLCSAEARGYSLAVAFALLAFAALRAWLERGGRGWLVLFWLPVVLGFLAHLTFLHCYLALFLWSLRHFARQGKGARAEVGPMLRCHAVPGAFVLVLYFVDVRHMVLGGGPPVPTGEVLTRLLGLGLGGPPAGPRALGRALLAAVGAGWGLWWLARQGESVWVFFAVATVGAPALFLVKRPPFLFERYFLISFVFLLLLLSYSLGDLWRRGPVGRVAATLLLLAVVGGNVWQVLRFVSNGRGQFHEALAFVAEHDDGATIDVTGDHDFRIAKFCAFYGPRVADRPFVYHRGDALPPAGATWLIVHRLDERHPPGAVERDAAGNEYRLVRAWPSAGLGSWGCFVYRNAKLPVGLEIARGTREPSWDVFRETTSSLEPPQWPTLLTLRTVRASRPRFTTPRWSPPR